MKKILLLLASILIFAACGDDEKTEPTTVPLYESYTNQDYMYCLNSDGTYNKLNSLYSSEEGPGDRKFEYGTYKYSYPVITFYCDSSRMEGEDIYDKTKFNYKGETTTNANLITIGDEMFTKTETPKG